MKYNFWFVVGSQDLYGEEVLKTVAQRAAEMAAEMSKALPFSLIYKVTAMSNAQITQIPHKGVGGQTADEEHDQCNDLVGSLGQPVVA